MHEESCGWYPSNFPHGRYLCLPEGYETADPSGVYPRECSWTCIPHCEDGVECGDDGCGGSCGSCPEGWACNGGTCCQRQCDGRNCGWDGCGSYCGNCEDGWDCDTLVGRCYYAHGCEPTDTPGCRDCACTECVCQLNSVCCSFAWDVECAGLCEEACGGCRPCTPGCGTRECGADGCGWTCGFCGDGATCVDGQCVSTGDDASPSEEVRPDHGGDVAGEGVTDPGVDPGRDAAGEATGADAPGRDTNGDAAAGDDSQDGPPEGSGDVVIHGGKGGGCSGGRGTPSLPWTLLLAGPVVAWVAGRRARDRSTS